MGSEHAYTLPAHCIELTYSVLSGFEHSIGSPFSGPGGAFTERAADGCCVLFGCSYLQGQSLEQACQSQRLTQAK